MLRLVKWTARGALIAVVALPGCGEEERPAAGAGDEYSAELFPSTRVLSDEALAALAAFEPDGTLRFTSTPRELADVVPWQVVMGAPSGAAPKGMLRVVTAVEPDGSGLVLRTAQAPIQLAFRKLHVAIERHVPDLATADTTVTPVRPLDVGGGGQKSVAIDFHPIDGDDSPGTDDDQVHMKGTLSGGFDFSLGIDVDWGDVFEVPSALTECLKNLIGGSGCSIQDLMPEARVRFSVQSGAKAAVAMSGVTFLPYDAPYEVPEIPLPQIPIGPLVFFPSVKVKAEIGGQASSRFAFDMSAAASVGMKVDLSSKDLTPNVPEPTASFDFDAANVDATLQASGRIELGPELHVRLYDIAGPYAGLYAFAELSADQAKSPCWELHAGVRSRFGFDIVTPDLPLIGHATLADFDRKFDIYDELVQSGACKPLPGGDAPSSTGGDPDPASFANPAFTPWSRTYSGVVDGHPVEAAGAQMEWLDATPTIDGRFVLAGSDTKALVKIRPDGSLVWAKRYLGPEVYADTLTHELLPSRILHMGDGTMLVVAHPYTLLKVEASGAVVWARRLDVPYHEETIRLTSVAPAPGGGFYVGGTAGDDRIYAQRVDAWLMRFDANGKRLWSRRWGTAEEGETLRALVPFADGVIAAGATWAPSVSHWRAWTARLDADGKVVWSKSYDARECGSSYESSAFVTTGIVAKDGDLVLAGSISAARDATLVFKLKPDGALAWFASDGAVEAVHPGPSVSSIVELPTSGYLLAGTLRYSRDGTYSGSQQDVWLGSGDGVGRLQWLRRYGGSRMQKDVPRYSDTYGSVSLTKDGGALLVGFTDTLTPEGSGLWAMKVPAKDGVIAFDPSTTATTEVVSTEGKPSCFTQQDAPIAPIAHDIPFAPVAVTVESVSAVTHAQTP